MASVSYCPRCLTTFRGDEAANCPNLSCSEERPSGGWGVVLQPGDLIDRHYRIERVLAVGGAGLTYLTREVGGEGQPVGPELAVKVLYAARASGAYLTRLATEAQILQELDHENIVQCRGFVHRAGHEPYLVTLFEHGGSLAGHLRRAGPLAASVAFGILRQVLLGLDMAHQRGVVHRDLKPDNVLLAAPVPREVVPLVRVADFGIAKVAGGLNSRVTKLGAFVGTPEYAAPEQFEQQAATAATDVFACGGLLHFMLTGEAPVRLSRRADIEVSYAELLEQLPPVIREAAGCSAAELAVVNDILRNAMAAKAEHRWTAHQVIAALQPLLTVPGVPAGFDTLELTREPAPRRGVVPAPAPGTLVAVSDPEPSEDPFAPQAATGPSDDPALAKPEGTPPETPPVPVEAPASEAPGPAPASPSVAAVPPPPPPPPSPPVPSPPRRGLLGRLIAAVVGVAGAGVAVIGALFLVGLALLAVWFAWPMFEGEGPELTGADRAELQAQVQRALDRDHSDCKASGRVIALVSVATSGAVREVVVERSSLKDPEAAACATDRIEAVSAEPRDGPATARLTLSLR